MPHPHIIIADNQFITNSGLTALLNEYSLVKTIAYASSTKALQRELAQHPRTIVIVDYALFDFTSIQQMLIIKEAAKDSLWILFSNELSDLFLRQVLISDPSFSIAMKHSTKEELIATLKSVSTGNPYVCESAESVLHGGVPHITPSVKLTSMEQTVLREIAMGKTTKEIAYEKVLSFHTVNTHRRNIFRKLEINNMHEAAKYALRAGLIEVAEYCI